MLDAVCRLSDWLHQYSINQRLNSQKRSWFSQKVSSDWWGQCEAHCLENEKTCAPPTHTPTLTSGVAGVVVGVQFWRVRLETATGLTVQHFLVEKICLLAVTISPHLMPIWPPFPPKTITSFEFSRSHSSSCPTSVGSPWFLSSPLPRWPFFLLTAPTWILKLPVCPHLSPSDVCIPPFPPSGLVYQ